MARGRQRPARVKTPKQLEAPKTVEVAKREPKRLDMSVVITVPTMEHLLTSATSILHSEFGQLLDRVRRRKPLTEVQSKKFSRYVKALKDLSDEDRAQRREGELDRLGDEALVEELLNDGEFVRMLRERLDGIDGDE